MVNNVIMNTPPWISFWAKNVYPLHTPYEEQPEALAKVDPDSGMACDFNKIIHEIQILNSTAPRGSSMVKP